MERQWWHSGDSTLWIYQPIIFSTMGTSLNWLHNLQVQRVALIICPLLGSNMNQALSSHYPENVHSWATKQRYVLFDCCEANIPPFLLGTVLPKLNSAHQVTFTCPKCCVIASPFCLSFHNMLPPPFVMCHLPFQQCVTSPFCDVLPPPSATRHLPLLQHVTFPFRNALSPPSATHHLPLLRHVTSPFHNVLPPPFTMCCLPLWWCVTKCTAWGCVSLMCECI